MDFSILKEELLQNLNTIRNPAMQQFVKHALEDYGNEAKLEEANAVCDAILAKCRKQKLLTEQSYSNMIDVFIAASMIHNLFYDPADWRTLLDCRYELYQSALLTTGNQMACDAIFQTVEGQLGEDSPIPLLKPSPNTPGDAFADAVWMVKDYIPSIGWAMDDVNDNVACCDESC